MIVYGDRHEWLTPGAALTRLHEALDRVRHPGAGAGEGHASARACRHDGAIELLIEAGILEQAVADIVPPGPAGRHPVLALVARLTDLAADAVARSDGPGALPPPPAGGTWWDEWERAATTLLAALAAADLPSPLAATLPEGYLFYALYPEAYLARLRQILAAERAAAPAPHVVVGVRSIGTSLGAIAATACREAGLPVRRLTVRPWGDPFSRRVSLDAAQTRDLRSLAARGARFILVDEGPGLSGSSLAGLARALREEAGVRHEAMVFLCANPWPGPEAPGWALDYWRAVPCWPVDGACLAGTVEKALAALTPMGPGAAVVEADLSGGLWREHVAFPTDMATSHPRFERRKYLCRDGRGGRVWAKFVGLGRVGRLKAQRARALSARGYVPPVLGYAHGFLFSAHSAAPALRHDVLPGPDALARIAGYYGHLAALSRDRQPEPAAATFARLRAMVAANTRAWFGGTLDHELAALPAWESAVAQTGKAGGDGKPQPHEWLGATPLLKCDAADHYLDHGAVWPVDPAYDVAGTLAEWGLDAARGGHFVGLYIAASGDAAVGARLPFYAAVYAAALLGQHDMAYHLEGGAGPAAGRHDRARRRYAEMLRGALTSARATTGRAAVGATR